MRGAGGGVRLLLVFPRSTIDNGKESARTIDVGNLSREHGSGKNLHMTDRISCRAAQHPAAAASTDVAHGTADRAAATGTAGPLRLPLARRCLNPVLLELTEWRLGACSTAGSLNLGCSAAIRTSDVAFLLRSVMLFLCCPRECGGGGGWLVGARRPYKYLIDRGGALLDP